MLDYPEAIVLPERVKNLAGQKYGRLTALRPIERRKNGHVVYVCQCDCGGHAAVTSSNLRSGHTQSCGCLLPQVVGVTNATHKRSATKIYRVWTQMIQRCTKAYAPNYKWYGASGVVVDPSWESFEQFYADMGDPPPGLTLERLDHEGPYSKQNCVWATRKVQASNTRRTRRVTYQGVTKSVTDWERDMGVRKDFFGKRLRRGLSVERAFEDRNRRDTQ